MKWATTIAFGLLVALAIGVFFLLPRAVENGAAPEPAPRTPMRETAEVASPVPAAVSEPGNTGAASGLRSAEVLDEVAAQLDRGAEPERAGVPSGAERHNRRSAQLDPSPGASRAATARTRDPIAEDGFADIISQGLAALDAGDPASARAAFQRAKQLRPESIAASDGLTRAENALEIKAIARQRDRARTAESSEAWREAAQAYGAALEIEATLAFAQEGKRRSQDRADLDELLEFHIGHPERMASPEVLAEANELLERARSVGTAGPRLTRQTEQLTQAITVASTPLRVELVSDGLTSVVIYKVGRLGSFSRTAVELRPGSYTVVGSRKGFRDVRITVAVRPDSPIDPIVVRCEEEI